MARKTAKGPAAGSDPVVEGIPEDAGPEDATAPLPKEKPLGSSKAVETMFRNATRAELELIALAATKANIMISLNGLIISALMISGAFIFAQISRGWSGGREALRGQPQALTPGISQPRASSA